MCVYTTWCNEIGTVDDDDDGRGGVFQAAHFPSFSVLGHQFSFLVEENFFFLVNLLCVVFPTFCGCVGS